MTKNKISCPRCNAELWPDSIKCWSCGLELKNPSTGPEKITAQTNSPQKVLKIQSIKLKNCPKCGAELYDDSIRCWSCGYELPTTEQRLRIVKWYLLELESLSIPESRKTQTASHFKENPGTYIWRDQDNLCLFPYLPDEYLRTYGPYVLESYFPNNLPINRVPIPNIIYFKTRGRIYDENKISGGGGGGVSLGGALLGYVIAGGVGAIVGSRQKMNPIKSELVTHDTRETLLKYSVNGEDAELVLGIEAYEILMELIPEKEFTVVTSQRASTSTEKSQEPHKNEVDTISQIREFAKLKDEGIISQEEFELKKKQLLGI